MLCKNSTSLARDRLTHVCGEACEITLRPRPKHPTSANQNGVKLNVPFSVIGGAVIAPVVDSTVLASVSVAPA